MKFYSARQWSGTTLQDIGPSMLAPMTISSSAARPRLHSQVLHPAVCRLPKSLPSSGAKHFASYSLRLAQRNPLCVPVTSRRAAVQPTIIKSEAATFTSETNQAANPLRIVFVSAEVGPWSKTGGLGDVVGGLPIALAQRGHSVLTIAPRYRNFYVCCFDRICHLIGCHTIGCVGFK